MPQYHAIFRYTLPQQLGHFPKCREGMINTDCAQRTAPRNYVLCPPERGLLASFNIHFDECDIFPVIGVIQPNNLSFRISIAQSTRVVLGCGSVHGIHPSVVLPHAGIEDSHLLLDFIGQLFHCFPQFLICAWKQSY